MHKKQIIPFLILVLITAAAAYFIVGAGTYEPFVDSLQKKQVQVQTPPVIQPATTTIAITEPVSSSTPTTTEPVATTTPAVRQPDPEPTVTDFFSCVDVTGTILESYPRQCVFSDKTFVEQIKELVEVPGDAIELVVEVGPELVDCIGVAEQTCLMVDGDLFYDDIVGFDHEAGYRYSLKLKRTLAWGTTDPEKIPADAGLYKYELSEVLSKEPVVENNCVVAGCSSQLCISKEEQEAGGGISTCEFREEYACYRFSECKPQPTGECGWTMTPEVTQCLENPPTLQ